MKTLMHHKNYFHDFNSNWQLSFESWSHLPKEIGFDGFSSSSLLEEKSSTGAELQFIYTDVLSASGEKKATDLIQKLGAKGASTFVLCDLSNNIISQKGPFKPNQSLFDDNEFSNFAEAIQRVANYSRSLGHNTLYHPHLGSGVQNHKDIERLLAKTDLDLLVDTAHLLFLRIYKLQDYLNEIKDRVKGLCVQDYLPCVWAHCRQGGLSYLDSLPTNIFTHPAELGVKINELQFLVPNLEYLLIAGEKAPHLVETTAALRTSLARLAHEGAVKVKQSA